jgi:prepilin-type N-terminal cleavage/methylation domain-containing protein
VNRDHTRTQFGMISGVYRYGNAYAIKLTRRSRMKQKAFTLVEMIVVIGIIVILTALLLPAIL